MQRALVGIAVAVALVVAGAAEPARPPKAALSAREAGYLAGYLAALEAQRAGEQTVSTIGDAAGAAEGFRAGARAALPDVRILRGTARGPAACRALALDQVARGSFVVLADARTCGTAALAAVRAGYVWAVPAGTAAPVGGPHVLTSVVLRGDAAALGPISAVVPRDELARIHTLTGRIRLGLKVD